ncbi:hypothetical protein [Escherichia phage vB_EcoM-LTH01]
MANIVTLLKHAKQVLFSDHEVLNKDITGVRNLKDIQDLFGIRLNMKRVGTFGDKVLYQNGDYNFTLTIVS